MSDTPDFDDDHSPLERPAPRVDVAQLRALSLCTGILGLDLAVEGHFGAEVVAVSEVDAAASKVIERHHPGAPNIGDLKVADWASLGPIDIICGGIPCQPWSTAGKLGRTDDDRHLWPYVARAVGILRPRYVVVEEVAGFLVHGGLDAVLADLCALGFDAEWTTARASDIGAPHRRERVFLFAWDAERPPTDAFAPEGGSRRAAGESGGGAGVDLLPTPCVADSNGHAQVRGQYASNGTSLAGAISLLPTPMAHADGKSPEAHMAMKANMKGGARTKATDLRVVLTMLPTPTVSDGKGGPGSHGTGGDNLRTVAASGRWGDYAAAIERWELVMGREAPAPLDGKRLSADFVEWMMGYPEDWTAGLSRTARLKCLGNAVVTRQALYALEMLTARSLEVAA